VFKIGDFSRLTRVSMKTLRHYDDIRLFDPAQVDRFTGYRYYTFDQLPRLNRILALKELGFTLEQIARLLDDELPIAEVRGMFKLKRAEIEQQVQAEQARLARLDMRLVQIEMEAKMPDYEIVIKRVPPCPVAAIRMILPSAGDIGRLFDGLERDLRAHGLAAAGFPFAIWHDSYYSDQDIDIEVAVPLGKLPEGDLRSASARVRFYETPAVEHMACVVHHGDYGAIDAACRALGAWIEANGYRIAGPNREIYLRFGVDGPGAGYPQDYLTDDPAEYVTELQFTVQALDTPPAGKPTLPAR